MLVISGISITTKIYESSNSLVYRGVRKQDNQPVVLKILNSAYPTPELLSRYNQEFKITYNLELVGVIKPFDDYLQAVASAKIAEQYIVSAQ